MKRFLPIFILLCSFALTSYGQRKKIQYNPSYDKRPFHLGFSLGINNLDYRVIPSHYLLFSSATDSIYRVEPVSTIGLNLAIVSDLRMGEYLNLRFQPGMIFGQRNLVYQVRDFSNKDELVLEEYIMSLPSIYLDFPVSVKLRAKRINNYRPYLLIGGAIKYDLETKRVSKENDGYAIQQSPIDYFYEFGFGIDWYMLYFKLTTEIKFSFGLKNILVAEEIEYARSIESLHTRMLIFSFHFE